jgi:hypothetical protein
MTSAALSNHHTIRFSTWMFILGFALAGTQPAMAQAGAQTKNKRVHGTTTHETVENASAASVSASGYSHYDTQWGLGFASAYNVTSSNTALTGWIGLSPKFGIQPLLSVGSTSPFNFAAGALGKYTIVQQGAGGFHLGGGLTLGSVHVGSTGGGTLFGNSAAIGAKTGFSMGLTALAGVHYQLPNTSIMLHFDGGANFGLIDGDTDFNLGSTIGGLLGASIIYMF